MFLDDVSLTACTGGVTLVPTGGVTLVPTGGVTLIPERDALPTPTPSGTPAPVCVDAIVNGDFTGGLTSWQPVGDLAGIAVITNPVHSTPYAVQLGSLTLNLNGLATIRQLVTIPTEYSQNTLGVWIYTQTQSGTDADFQEIALWNFVRHRDRRAAVGGGRTTLPGSNCSSTCQVSWGRPSSSVSVSTTMARGAAQRWWSTMCACNRAMRCRAGNNTNEDTHADGNTVGHHAASDCHPADHHADTCPARLR